MHHLYFLTTNLYVTKKITNELRNKGLPKDQIYIMGQNSGLLKKTHFNEAQFIHTSDFIPAVKRGAIYGILNSIVFGLIYYFFELKYGFTINLMILAILILMGIVLGAWGSSLIGISINPPFVEKFQELVKKGNYIIIAEARNDNEIKNIQDIASQHAELKFVIDKE